MAFTVATKAKSNDSTQFNYRTIIKITPITANE